MDERHAKILSTLVTAYIRTGQPVSSKQLARQKEQSLSPASIRSVMQDLCDAGYTYQQHTSGGRIPTDKGLRFYLDHVIVEPLSSAFRAKLHQQYANLIAQHESTQLAMAELLAHVAHSLAVVASTDNCQFEQSGTSILFKDIDANQLGIVQEISDLLDNMHRIIKQISHHHDNAPTVFIGQENPYFSSQQTCLMLRVPSPSANNKQAVMLIGSKRMPYQRNLALLNEIENIFN